MTRAETLQNGLGLCGAKSSGSKPHADSNSYDVGVEHNGKLVQSHAVSMACTCSVEVLVLTSALVTSTRTARRPVMPGLIYGALTRARLGNPRRGGTIGLP